MSACSAKSALSLSDVLQTAEHWNMGSSRIPAVNNELSVKSEEVRKRNLPEMYVLELNEAFGVGEHGPTWVIRINLRR